MSRATSVFARRRLASSSSRVSRGPADPFAGRLALQNTGVAEPPPFGDLGRVQALGPQVGAATAVGAGRLVRGEVLELLPGGERPPRSGAARSGAARSGAGRGIHQAILADHSNSRHRIEPVLALR